MSLELTRLFVKVVQNGSFSKAADLLKIPKSTVSKAVSRLERETGTKLLLRTTRSLTLTAAGRAFYETCLSPIQVLEEAERSLSGQDSMMSGLVKITAPEDLGSHVVAPVIAELSKKHSALSFELQYTDDVVDLVKDGFDLAVRIGKLNESSFKAKRAGEVFLIAVASKTYFKKLKSVQHPRELANFDCLTYNDQSFQTRWTVKSKKETYTVHFKPRISSNQMSSLLKIALSGAGIAMIPNYLCQPYLESGELVQILPQWKSAGMQVSLISPLSASTSARLKITSDHLLMSLKDALGSNEL